MTREAARSCAFFLNDALMTLHMCASAAQESADSSLTACATKYVSVTCTNVESERLFSTISDNVDEKKKLTVGRALTLVFVVKNLLSLCAQNRIRAHQTQTVNYCKGCIQFPIKENKVVKSGIQK